MPLPDEVYRWKALAEKYGQKYGIDPAALLAITNIESGGNPKAYSWAGATGLTQVMASDAKFKPELFKDRPTSAQLQDPEVAMDWGAKIFKQKLDAYGGNYGKAYYYYGEQNAAHVQKFFKSYIDAKMDMGTSRTATALPETQKPDRTAVAAARGISEGLPTEPTRILPASAANPALAGRPKPQDFFQPSQPDTTPPNPYGEYSQQLTEHVPTTWQRFMGLQGRTVPERTLTGGLEGYGDFQPQPELGVGETLSRILDPAVRYQEEFGELAFGPPLRGEGFQPQRFLNPPDSPELREAWHNTPEPFPGFKGALEVLAPDPSDILFGTAPIAIDLARGAVKAGVRKAAPPVGRAFGELVTSEVGAVGKKGMKQYEVTVTQGTIKPKGGIESPFGRTFTVQARTSSAAVKSVRDSGVAADSVTVREIPAGVKPPVSEPAPSGTVPIQAMHGSPTPDLQSIKPSPSGDWGNGVYFATEFRTAEEYSMGRANVRAFVLGDTTKEPTRGVVYNLDVSLKNPLIIDSRDTLDALMIDAGKTYGNETEQNLANLARSRGYDGIIDNLKNEGIAFNESAVKITGTRPATGMSTQVMPPSGTVPPKEPPIATTAATPPTPSGPRPIDEIITRAKEMAKQTEPNIVTRTLARIPGIGHGLTYEGPRLKMQGENVKVREAMIAENMARVRVSTEALPGRTAVVDELTQAFGKDVVNGKAQTSYVLSPEQKLALGKMQAHNDTQLANVVNGYGADIGKFVIEPQAPKAGTGTLLDVAQHNGYFLPNAAVKEDLAAAIQAETRAVASGTGKTRLWQTAAERQAADPAFHPVTDVPQLLEGLDNFKANAASGMTMREALGGMKRTEVLKITHPQLYAKMQGLRRRLISLQSSAGTLDTNLHGAIDRFLKSDVESVDLENLQRALDVKLKGGPRRGMGQPDIQKQMDGVRAQIKALQPSWKNAILRGYTRVEEGIYRYFPDETAKLIVESRASKNNKLVQFIDMWRQQVLSGDFSPFSIQGALGVLFDPIGSIQTIAGGLKRGVQGGNPLRSLTLDGFIEAIAKDPQGWARYAADKGRTLVAPPQEFAAGLLSKIPGFNKFNEATYRAVTMLDKAMYDRTWQSLVKGGLSEDVARTASAIATSQVFPLANAAVLGQSASRARFLRMWPTSYSFIRKPAELMTNAASGLIKMGTKQTMSPTEKLAVRLMITWAATTATLSATSAAIEAQRTGKDVEQAMLDAINPDPKNGKFLTVVINGRRVPLGGPYRALFRAIYPQDVPGVPIPIPFAGIPRFLGNRVTPAIKAQWNLKENKDFDGNKIMQGDFPEQIIRAIAYEFETALPLTLGTGVAGIRTGQEPGDIAEQMAGQVLGVNIMEDSPAAKYMKARQELALQRYGIPFEKLEKGKRDIITSDPQIETLVANLKSDVGEPKQQMSLAFQQQKTKYTSLEADLKTTVQSPKVSPKTLTEAIQNFKRDRFTATDTLFNNPAVQGEFKKDTTHLFDKYAEQYWAVPLSKNESDGSYDYNTQQTEQQAIIKEAVAAGVPAKYITGTGDGTFRGKRYDDPVVRDAVEKYEEATRILRPYWEVATTLTAIDPKNKPLFDAYMAQQKSNPDAAARMATDIKAIGNWQKAATQIKAAYMLFHPEIEMALATYYDAGNRISSVDEWQTKVKAVQDGLNNPLIAPFIQNIMSTGTRDGGRVASFTFTLPPKKK